jgi:hypothetical protein
MADLYQVSSRFFMGGVVLKNGTVVRASPIISFMKGWRSGKVAKYCRARNWDYTKIHAGRDVVAKEIPPGAA